MQRDQITDSFIARAQRYVAAEFPDAEAAFLGGSAVTLAATDSSDLDLLVLVPSQRGDAAFVETTSFEGQLIEAFVYTPSRLEEWLVKGRGDRRPVLDRLIADGQTLIDGEISSALQTASIVALSAGPSPLSTLERDARRYALSALIDDLADAIDPAERGAIAYATWREGAELALLNRGHWLGTGKWLVRELRAAADPHNLAEWLAHASRDSQDLGCIIRAVLDEAGGYLQSGMIRGNKPSAP